MRIRVLPTHDQRDLAERPASVTSRFNRTFRRHFGATPSNGAAGAARAGW